MNNKQQNPGMGIILISQLAIVLLGGLAIWVLGLSLPSPGISWISACILGVALALVTFALFFVLFRYGGKLSQTLLADIHRISRLFIGYSWLRIMCIATLAGIGEELLFRGFFQTWLNTHLDISWAILIVSLIFGLLHYLSHAYFICTVLMSMAFCIGYYLTGSLLMVMVWHGVYDLIALGVIVNYPQLIAVDDGNSA